jgi:hypothetical protein
MSRAGRRKLERQALKPSNGGIGASRTTIENCVLSGFGRTTAPSSA